MWCRHCRQDVPALASPDRRKYCCPRCGETLCAEAAEKPHEAPPSAAQSSPAEPPAAEPVAAESAPAAVVAAESAPDGPPQIDGWELDEQLRHIERVLRVGKAPGRRSKAAHRRERLRIDPAHAGESAWHVPAVTVRRRRRAEQAARSGGGSLLSGLAWTALSLGTMALVCGGVLLGWSVFTGREELWTVGMPATVAGQVALAIGLILQLDRLWHDSRHSAVKLDAVDQQLHELKTTAAFLGTAHGPAGSTFYTHFAQGAAPQLLLTDLKGQLDLLALRLAQEQ